MYYVYFRTEMFYYYLIHVHVVIISFLSHVSIDVKRSFLVGLFNLDVRFNVYNLLLLLLHIVSVGSPSLDIFYVKIMHIQILRSYARSKCYIFICNRVAL